MSNQLDVTKKGLKKPALGRGLGSLLGGMPPGGQAQNLNEQKEIETIAAMDKSQVNDLTNKVWNLEIERVFPNPNQPRKEFLKNELDSLANSIKAQGILQPITVRRRADGKFEIIAGERRWRAAQLAKLSVVPALIKEVDDKKSLELALIENIQRADLNPVEEAEAYQYLMKEHHMTQQELAEQVGKERATVANVLRLLQLDKDVRDWVSQGFITMAQAKVLLSIQDVTLMKTLAKKTKDQKLTVRALEKLARESTMDTEEKTQSPISTEHKVAVKALQERLQKNLGTKIELLYNENNSGKWIIHFQSQDQLDKMLQKLGL